MMESIQLLDCTLRDGGYVNNWNFGNEIILKIYSKLCQSAVEIIECGFISETKACNPDMSVFNSISQCEKIFSAVNGQKVVAMINCCEFAPENIEEYNGGVLDTIRIAFHKSQIPEAKELCLALKSKGYKVFFQPMNTIGYSDYELLSLIDFANTNMPEAFYLVDSFGTMRKEDLLRMFYLVDNNLNKSIKVGFHSHNNLQLSFSNAQELISLNTKRNIIIDSSVFGMGRGAGNLCTELMTQYINENIEHKYNIIPILETMDEYIMPIYSKHPWGYSAPYYIAAINDCHPNYATYLINRQTLCIKDINNIIKIIPENKKNLFDKELINNLYLEYQSYSVDDSEALNSISHLCSSKKVLILAPGKSLLTYKNEIEEFIKKNDPIVFGINHIPKFHKYDRVFISNLKRFKSLDNAISLIKDKLICTSNISADSNLCALNYSSYLNSNEAIYDNSGLVLINILIKAGVTDFALAGYDGFSYADSKNYFDEGMANNVNAQRQSENNAAIIDYFVKIRRNVNITFITPTIYDNETKNEEI